MANKVSSYFKMKMAELVYKCLIAGHCEDYIMEEKGKVVTVPSGIWQNTMLENGRQR